MVAAAQGPAEVEKAVVAEATAIEVAAMAKEKVPPEVPAVETDAHPPASQEAAAKGSQVTHTRSPLSSQSTAPHPTLPASASARSS